jgi:3'-phosphoadenosine 5'-phosphosulfate sulfotransferase (PAPS reductase)/FAD synthetase
MNAVTRPHGGRNYRPKARKQNVYTHDQLVELQQMSLDDKIGWSHAVIEKTLPQLERPAVAFSAGKDSTVLLHLLRQYRPEIITIYGNTTIEFPECVKFARRLKDEWHLNYYEARPDVSFWWIVQEYGWPLLGKNYGVSGVAHKSSRAKFFKELAENGELTGTYAIQAEVPISSACCTFLKERPSARLQKTLGVDGVYLGILASESRRRMFNFLEYGEWYYAKSQQMNKCHPLAIWTDDDIWAYIRRFEVPYAQIYDLGYQNERGEFIRHKRNGCMFCGMDIAFPDNHLSIMRRTHPKAWQVLMFKKGLGKVLLQLRFAFDDHQYDMFEQSWSVEQYWEHFPCVFDRI